jgi:sterol desaturase/sphingolipid hydroxylase (fatty acid hydroxylase superfamily)
MLTMPTGFSFGNADTWPGWFYPLFGAIIFAGLEILAVIVPALFTTWRHIPIRGKHLDEFDSTDKFFVTINKFSTCLFVYHFMKYTTKSSNIKWGADEATFQNTALAFVLFYAFYDFFYMWFHWLLHNRNLYRFIHKHHHRFEYIYIYIIYCFFLSVFFFSILTYIIYITYLYIDKKPLLEAM